MKAFFVPGREQECIDLVSMMLQNIECDNIKVFFFFVLLLLCQCEAKFNSSQIII